MISRRQWIGMVVGGVALGVTGHLALADAPLQRTASGKIHVFKSPTCGCCSNWVEHLEENGFEVTTQDLADVAPIKRQHGVPDALASCHTGLVSGYVVEGHVPADVIRQLLEERPQVVGLAVPGMPMGSPGMEGPYKDPYDVIAFQADGQTHVYASR